LAARTASENSQSEKSITNYLMEFLPDSYWPYDHNPTTSQVNVIVAKFAENSFWPTGNNRASTLFFYAGCIFVAILYPVKTDDAPLIILSLVVMVAIAYTFRTILFMLASMPLAYVDDRLSKRKPELLDSIAPIKSLKIDHNIFISYRREDSSAYARLVHDALSPHTQAEKIFMDRIAIHDGDDFIDKITGAVLECQVLLVVIGPTWATCKNQGNEPRIMQAGDFVRLEIATGLASSRLVIPVLVGNATMPTAEQLPPELQPLLRKHARELSDSRWQYDTSQLLESLTE
jgi:hypothetical protein